MFVGTSKKGETSSKFRDVSKVVSVENQEIWATCFLETLLETNPDISCGFYIKKTSPTGLREVYAAQVW